MDRLIKINKILKTLIIVSLLFLVVGLSFSYFTANVTGEETDTTITTTGGTMNIVYNGGANINIANVYPKAEVLTNRI